MTAAGCPDPGGTRSRPAGQWIGLVGLALVLATAFVLLGSWQWTRAHRPSGPTSASSVLPLAQVSRLGEALPDSAVGTAVSVMGTYDPAHQVLVADRPTGDLWVLTPLRVADGSEVAVVRGRLQEGAPAPAPPPGPVTVTGVLQASEDPAGRPAANRGSISSITTEALVTAWASSLHDGFLVLTAQLPPSTLKPVPVPARVHPGGLRWQNTLYAIQWWLFAGFVIFVLCRIFIDDRRAAGRVGRNGRTTL